MGNPAPAAAPCHAPGVHKIRLARPADAAALLALQHRLDTQSSFMLLEPGEREQAPDRLRDRLQGQGSLGSFDLVAVTAGRLAGWLSVAVLPFRRASRTGSVVMGVDTDAAGRGIGSGMLTAAAQEARRRGLRRLELTVMADNPRALSLYLHDGFQVEGLRRQALIRDGAVVDEYYMGKLLPPRDGGPPG
jgi:ribosomal protein S18 acetylase RimI-like enzyme